LELFPWTKSVLTRVVLHATKGGGEIAGGEVVSRGEVRQIVAEFIGGSGLGFLASMEEAEVGMVPGAMGAATAAICEYAHGYAVLCARGHGFLLKVELEIKKPRGKRGAVYPKQE
jgi:hypothetical protein